MIWMNHQGIILCRKKPIPKSYIQYESNHRKYPKWQHFRREARLEIGQGVGWRSAGFDSELGGVETCLPTGQGQSELQGRWSSLSQSTEKPWLSGQFLYTLKTPSEALSFSNGDYDIKINTQVLAWGKKTFVAA